MSIDQDESNRDETVAGMPPAVIGMMISGISTIAYGFLIWYTLSASLADFSSCPDQPVEMTFAEFVAASPHPRWVQLTDYELGPLSWSRKNRSAYIDHYIHLVGKDFESVDVSEIQWFAVISGQQSRGRRKKFLEQKQFTGMIRTSCKPPPKLHNGKRIPPTLIRAVQVDDGPSFSTPVFAVVVFAISLSIFSWLTYLQFYLKRLKPASSTKDFSTVRIRSVSPPQDSHGIRWSLLDHVTKLIYRFRKLGWLPFIVASLSFLLAEFTVCALSLFFGFIIVFIGLTLMLRPIPIMFARRHKPVPQQDKINRFVNFWLEHPDAPAHDLGYVSCGSLVEDYRILLPEIPYAVIRATIRKSKLCGELISVTAKGKVIKTHNDLESSDHVHRDVPSLVNCVDTADILKLGGTHLSILEEYCSQNQDDWLLLVSPSKVPQLLEYTQQVRNWSYYRLLEDLLGVSPFKPQKLPCPAELGLSYDHRWWFEWEGRPEWRSIFDDIEFDKSDIPLPLQATDEPVEESLLASSRFENRW